MVHRGALASFFLMFFFVSPLAAQRIVTGSGNVPPHVKAFLGATEEASFFAYDPAFAGGVTVAQGDVDGDGTADIITGTASGAAQVKVFSGQTGAEIRSFLPYAAFSGGVFVASGDVDGDGRDDIITGTASLAPPHVKVFSGSTNAEMASFFAFAPDFTGGVTVGAGDVDGDKLADIIVGTFSGAAQVKVFKGTTLAELRSFIAYPSFSGGVFVAAGDVSGDGLADIVTGTASAGSHVKVFDGATNAQIASFFAFDPLLAGGVRVAAGDVNDDGLPDVIAGTGPGIVATVRTFIGPALAAGMTFLPYGSGFTGGVFVAGYDPQPTATITGNSDLCAIGTATISVTLTGTAPWTLTWSDGAIDSGIATSPFVRTVTSAGTYTITEVGDLTHLTGTTGGSALVEPGTNGCATADLSIAKVVDGSGPFLVGDLVAFDVTVTSSGPGTASGVVVTDALPASVALVSASATQGTCGAATPVVCTIGSLASGASATIQITVRITQAAEIANTATAAADQVDPVPANNSATARLSAAAVPGIPSLSHAMLALLALLLGLAAASKLTGS